MTDELIIHIGQPKTGTSSLQQFFFRNRKIFIEKGIYYPLKGLYSRELGHHNLGYELEGDARFKPSAGRWKDVLKEGKGHQKVLISTESLFKLLWNDSATFLSFIDSLKEKMNVRIVVALRRYDRYLESLYVQSLKGYRTKLTPNEFALSRISGMKRTCALMSDIIDHVGKSNLHIVCHRDTENIIDSFCSILGVQQKDFPKKINRASERVGIKCATLLYMINKAGIMDNKLPAEKADFNKKLSHIMENDFSGYNLIPYETVLQIQKKSQSSYHELGGLLGIDKPFDLLLKPYKHSDLDPSLICSDDVNKANTLLMPFSTEEERSILFSQCI